MEGCDGVCWFVRHENRDPKLWAFITPKRGKSAIGLRTESESGLPPVAFRAPTPKESRTIEEKVLKRRVS